jgi:toxin YoeB
MSYKIDFTENALDDIADLKKSEPKSYNKVRELLIELLEHPRTGTGKPKALKGEKNVFSRRITQKHRLVYEINDQKIIVLILAAKGHYDDR